ncbi:hypothetical protein CPB85DRAFT_743219 [Mucidula mucida]|nr:hypothetical protein CPB85DRAFT_743219 [Mucidula mucida]
MHVPFIIGHDSHADFVESVAENVKNHRLPSRKHLLDLCHSMWNCDSCLNGDARAITTQTHLSAHIVQVKDCIELPVGMQSSKGDACGTPKSDISRLNGKNCACCQQRSVYRVLARSIDSSSSFDDTPGTYQQISQGRACVVVYAVSFPDLLAMQSSIRQANPGSKE